MKQRVAALITAAMASLAMAQTELNPVSLDDLSFITPWQAQGVFDTPEKVHQFRHEAKEQIKRLDVALKQARHACLKAFYVERCEDEQKQKYRDRVREIRLTLKEAGNALQHMPPEPLKGQFAPINPGKAVHLLDEKVRENLVKPPSTPEHATPNAGLGRPSVLKPHRFEGKHLTHEQEEANQARFDKKLAEAEQRQAQALKDAEHRRQERLKKQAQFEARLRAQKEEQKRFEERQQSADPTGLGQYFRGE